MLTTTLKATLAYEELDFRLAERFCAVVLGADNLYRRGQAPQAGESALRQEGLAPVDFSGATAAPLADWVEAEAELTAIYQDYTQVKLECRRNYMWQQVGSFRKLCRWLSGQPFTYRETVAETMFIDANPVPAAHIEQYHRRLNQALAQAGYSGSLAGKLAAWREKRLVTEATETEAVLRDYLAEAREKTLALGLEPVRDFQVRPQVVFGVPYNAYCDYQARAIYINGDVHYTRDELKHLVCHEAYPGHMTHLAQRESLVSAGRIPADAGLVLTNTASSPVFEGLADNGMAMLNWQDDSDDQICLIFNQIQAMAALNAGHQLHAQGAGRAAVADYLRQAAFGSESWVQSRLRYIAFPLRAPFIYSYWRGWEAIGGFWAKLDAAQRRRFIPYLYNNMHTVDTALQFS